MSDRHIVITGAANGLGWGCVQEFAPAAAQITLIDKDEAAGRARVAELRSLHPRLVANFEPLDLADIDSIGALADRLLAAGRPIDVLVNNAGIFPPSQRMATATGRELTFAIAQLGHFTLTNKLWPLLRAAPEARVIGVSSMVQKHADLDLQDLDLVRDYSPMRAYRHAKLACLLFALELQRRLDASGIDSIRSYAVHPGICRSQLGTNRPRQSGDGLRGWLSYWFMALGMRVYGQTPQQAAAVVLAAADGDYPAGSFLGPVGWLQGAGPPGLAVPGPGARDPAVAAALWDVCLEWSGVHWDF